MKNQLTKVNYFQKYESHLFLLYPWLCLPTDDQQGKKKQQRYSLAQLEIFFQQCCILRLVSQAQKTYIEKNIYPKLHSFWLPLGVESLIYFLLDDEKGYRIWPHYETVCYKQSFAKTMTAFQKFHHLLGGRKAHPKILESKISQFFPFQSHQLAQLKEDETPWIHYVRTDIAEAAVLVYGNYSTYLENKRKIPRKEGSSYGLIQQRRQKKKLKIKEKKK